MKQQLGVIGLGTMGANLARNAARNGSEVVLFNRTAEKTDEFMQRHAMEGDFVPAKTIPSFVRALKAPRAILLMVKAGDAVDAVIEELLPHIKKGDTLIDAGNSHYRDTERRELALGKKGIRFVGMGVSGGEEGALFGPSMMPGGDRDAVKALLPLLKKMSANDGSGGKCVSFIGTGGAGHFVKMVHNGIEYGIMQLIAESYDLLRSIGKYSNKELASIFASWSKAQDLGSFLMEITATIFTVKDTLSRKDLIDVIVDAAGQKGTGKWTTDAAMTLGVAIPTINAAVDARILSGDLVKRRDFQKELPVVLAQGRVSSTTLVSAVRSALELSIICAYAQGFELMAAAAAEEGWNLNLSEIARIWRGGCIIRSHFLDTLQRAHGGSASARKEIVKRLGGGRQKQWRQVLSWGIASGVPLPAMSASLWFYDSLHRVRLPQNLIQAQRDFFGAHTYQRVDRTGTFHTEWNA